MKNTCTDTTKRYKYVFVAYDDDYSEKEYAYKTTDENKNFLDKYNILSISDFYRLSTMNNNFPLYIDMSIVWPTIEVLSKVIHDNGGKLFLAHPYKYVKGVQVNEVLDSCLPYIDGIEISNEPKTAEEVKRLYEYAKQKGLLVSAGSDFHGSKKHSNMNVSYLTDEMKTDIKNWINEVPGKINVLKK